MDADADTAQLPVAGGTRWKRLAARALDILYPPLCFSCRAPVADPHNLCSSCWNKIAFLDGPCCDRCGIPFEIDPGAETVCGKCLADPPAYSRARAVMRYDDASRDMILALKRADRLDMAPAFARWLRRAGAALLANSDVIVPVPLHRWRLWRRRFNQSALLANWLGGDAAATFDPLLLERIRSTPSQGEMPSAKARRRNVRGAFRVPPERKADVAGKRILLLDDVMTTGATADACARALKRAGAEDVSVLALARVVRGGADII